MNSCDASLGISSACKGCFWESTIYSFKSNQRRTTMRSVSQPFVAWPWCHISSRTLPRILHCDYMPISGSIRKTSYCHVLKYHSNGILPSSCQRCHEPTGVNCDRGTGSSRSKVAHDKGDAANNPSRKFSQEQPLYHWPLWKTFCAIANNNELKYCSCLVIINQWPVIIATHCSHH